jgi:acetyl esterase
VLNPTKKDYKVYSAEIPRSDRPAAEHALVKRGAGLLGVLAVLALAGYALVRASPWPSALLLRIPFDRQARALSRALAAHVPTDVVAWVDEHYDPRGRRTYLDVFHPAGLDPHRALPTVVWVHGGAWVSGSKELIGNYLRVLARHGFTVVGVGYSIAPSGRYPAPVVQVNTALGYLQRHAQRLHVDPTRFVLAGDSSGAQIAAQLANAVSVASYADVVGIRPAIDHPQLVGALLHCGAYDLGLVDLDGDWGWFLRTILWAYAGRKDFQADPRMASASVSRFVTPAFPPTFISAGNADPLLEQSRSFAAALKRQGVPVDALLFSEGTTPAAGHEFQFELDSAAGRLALERSVAFLRRQTASAAAGTA